VSNLKHRKKTRTIIRQLLERLEWLGHQIFYVVIIIGGQSGAYLLLLPVTFVYVLFSRKIHKQTSFYLQKKFPTLGLGQAWLATFKIVQSFGQILIDRAWLGIKKDAVLQGKEEGIDQLEKILEKKEGLILLTAHVGNWQTAISHICQLPAQINSLMHYEEEAVAKHYFDLKGQGCPFKIINTEGFMGGMVEATSALQRGEVVTIMGDRLEGGQHVEVEFLGSIIRLPISAYVLAACTGASIGIVFAAKTGKKSYSLRVWNVLKIDSKERSNRMSEIKKSAQIFAKSLEDYLMEYPYQWYNFYDYWNNA